MENPEKKPHLLSNGLWAPALIISVGFVVSLIFVLQTLKGYKKPRPLLIKPSSVETYTDVSEAIYKALYPIKQRGYGAIFSNKKASVFEVNLEKSISELFPARENNISFSFININLTRKIDLNKTDCINTALFNMNRKMKKWKKKIFFSVCTETSESFSIYYSLKK